MTEQKVIKPLATTKSQQTVQVVQSVSRNVAGLIVACGVIYLVATGAEISTYAWMFFFIFAAGLYGAESVLQVLQFRNGGK